MKKVVVIGPESTGKSTLCEHLARHYHTLWCPEYAREYLIKNGKDYTYDDLLTIAKGQIALEEDICQSSVISHRSSVDIEGRKEEDVSTLRFPDIPSSGLVFIDTDMYVMKVWCEYVFQKCHQYILDQIIERKYDLYLLCNIDLPWAPDELREYPDEVPRKELYRIYKDILLNQSVPWVEISGQHNERLQHAIGAVEKQLL